MATCTKKGSGGRYCSFFLRALRLRRGLIDLASCSVPLSRLAFGGIRGGNMYTVTSSEGGLHKPHAHQEEIAVVEFVIGLHYLLRKNIMQ